MNEESSAMDSVTLQPIGLIRSPFNEVAGMPVQAAAAQGVKGAIDLLPQYVEGLRDLEGFSHLVLIYHLHRMTKTELTVKPFLGGVNAEHGVFATRSPARPNHLGISVVHLQGITGNRLDIEDVDVLDGTPLLDIKPYVPRFDDRAPARTGWLEEGVTRLATTRSDERFSDDRARE